MTCIRLCVRPTHRPILKGTAIKHFENRSLISGQVSELCVQREYVGFATDVIMYFSRAVVEKSDDRWYREHK